MTCKLLTSGYKDISLIDIYNSVSFTIWLCGCNYMCPFCHNWRLAIRDPELCKLVSIEEFLEKMKRAVKLIDYLHVTGGEPLLQINCLINLLGETHSIGLKNSINSNLSLPDNLAKLLDEKIVDHVATDLKIPFNELTGLTSKSIDYWKLFIESLEILSNYNILFELRIPVVKELTIKHIVETLLELKSILNRFRNYYIIVFPIIGEPVVSARDRDWCSKYCNPDYSELINVSSVVREILDTKVIVKHWWNIG